MNRSVYVAIPLMAVLAVLQAAVLSRFPIAGIVAQPVLPATLAWGLLRGPWEGMVWAFVGGLFLDLFSLAPMGVTSLALMAAVPILVRARQSLPEGNILVTALLLLLGLTVYFVVYLIVIRVAGFAFNWQALGSLPATLLFHAFLGLPIFWLLNYLKRALYPQPIAT